jgi:hypothetical protein
MPLNQVGSDEVGSLRHELALASEKLEAAEWALAHLGSGDQPLERRLHALVEQAIADAQRIRTEARIQVETLVAEAEQLRDFARQGAEGSARQAREEVILKMAEMVEDAKRLRASAEQQAAEIVRTAQARYAEVKARADDLQRTTEQTLATALEKKAEVDRAIVDARERAGSIMRTAKAEAEVRAREMIELARTQLASAQQEAEGIMRVAEQQAIKGRQ